MDFNRGITVTPEGEALLISAGQQLGLNLSTSLPAFSTLYQALLTANARMNLTAITDERGVILKHFIDSLGCLQGGWLAGARSIVDLGTGAGFPALPLAIVRPALQVTALDATAKKIEFVTNTAQTLGLGNLRARAGRAEEFGHDPAHRQQYQRVVTRAVASLPVLAELALPLLQEGGLLLAQKAQPTESELQAGRAAASLLGGELFHVEHYQLPVSGDARSLVIFRKIGSTPALYPRRAGVPNRKPLAGGA